MSMVVISWMDGLSSKYSCFICCMQRSILPIDEWLACIVCCTHALTDILLLQLRVQGLLELDWMGDLN